MVPSPLFTDPAAFLNNTPVPNAGCAYGWCLDGSMSTGGVKAVLTPQDGSMDIIIKVARTVEGAQHVLHEADALASIASIARGSGLNISARLPWVGKPFRGTVMQLRSRMGLSNRTLSIN